jgi:hypothetical protein
MQRYGLLAGIGVLLCGVTAVAIYAQKPDRSTTPAKYAISQPPQGHSGIAPRADARAEPSSARFNEPLPRGTSSSAAATPTQLPRTSTAVLAAQPQPPGALSAAATPPATPMAVSALAQTAVPRNLAAGAWEGPAAALARPDAQSLSPAKSLIEASIPSAATAAVDGPSPQQSGTPASAVPSSARPEPSPAPARDVR